MGQCFFSPAEKKELPCSTSNRPAFLLVIFLQPLRGIAPGGRVPFSWRYAMSEKINGTQIRQAVQFAAIPKYEEVALPKYTRCYFDVEKYSPSSNYTQVLMASAKWRAGKGARLGSAWMFKPDKRQKLLIEQYGQECSVLRMDLDQMPAKFDTTNKMTEPGLSIWTDFVSVNGTIEDVVAMQKNKGWILVQPERKHQLELVDAVTA